MKIRTGFVSNSSSSSFVVAVKPGTELTKDKLVELFQVPETSPLRGISEGIARFVADASKPRELVEILYDYGYSSITDALEDNCKPIELINSGYKVYTFYASDDSGDGLETMLCYTEFDINTPELVISGGGGY